MKSTCWLRTLLKIALAALALTVLPASSAAQSPQPCEHPDTLSPEQHYDCLKQLEDAFPFPTNTATVDMGTFFPYNPLGRQLLAPGGKTGMFSGPWFDNWYFTCLAQQGNGYFVYQNTQYGGFVGRVPCTQKNAAGQAYTAQTQVYLPADAVDIVLKFAVSPDVSDFQVSIDRISAAGDPYPPCVPGKPLSQQPVMPCQPPASTAPSSCNDCAPPYVPPPAPAKIYYDLNPANVNQSAPAPQFNVQRNGSAVTLSVGGRYYKPGFTVAWTLTAGGKQIKGTVAIGRPPLIGAGVFMVPAIPVTIVYEPPQPRDPNLHNTVTYLQTRAVGTTVGTSFSQEQSSTQSVSTEFSDVEGFKKTLSGAAGVASAASAAGGTVGAIAGGIAKGLNTFAGMLGSASGTRQVGGTVYQDGTAGFSTSTSQQINVGYGKGPGLGDKFYLLKNAAIAWMFHEGKMHVYVLSATPVPGIDANILIDDLAKLGAPVVPASQIRQRQTGLATPALQRWLAEYRRQTIFNQASPPSPPMLRAPRPGVATTTTARPPHFGLRRPFQTQSGLDADTIVALLRLDPFVYGGPHAELPTGRFVFEEAAHAEVYGSPNPGPTIQLTQSVTTSDTNSQTDFTVETLDYSPGLLSFLGIGVTDEKHLKSVIRASGSRNVTETNSVSTTATYNNAPGDPQYTMEAWYDTIFGTYAFLSDELPGPPAVSGTVTDSSGTPLAGQEVVLSIGRMRFHARTDAQGKYVMDFRRMPAGVGTLSAAGATQRVIIGKGVHLQNQNLRVQAVRGLTTRPIVKPLSRPQNQR